MNRAWTIPLFVAAAVIVVSAVRPAAAQSIAGLPRHRLAVPALPTGGMTTVALEPLSAAAVAAHEGPLVVEGFPLGPGVSVDLRVERFRVTRPWTQFVAGDRSGPGTPFEFDPEQIVLLRGEVVGRAGSSVYLALSPWGSNGFIDLGPGRARYAVSWLTPAGIPLPIGQLAVAPVSPCGPNPETCHLWEDEPDPPSSVPPAVPDPVKGLRQIELAVETDNAFFQLFGNEQATAAYVVELYGAVSAIFMHEINTRVDLTYVRVWPLPNEPFQASLSWFQSYWGSNMQSVHRDVAQMFSGRADLPGGVAYLNALCTISAYSFCGNATGYFFGHDPPNVYNYDLQVTAHELGHNFGTGHTDAYGLDNCNLVQATPQRGTIMSYCNQTVSGGMGVIDLRFHKVTQQKMRDYIATVTAATCVVFDCNQNGISDAIDIASGFSGDVNTNGIPDECEDCNRNGVLDPQDIAAGTSPDLNANGIPDECEPDCNANGVPDDRDILLGTSLDFNADNVPDECEADCNGNGTSDYTEITTTMTLDKDRNIVPDSCQDCDNDGIPDLAELEGADNAWVASLTSDAIREYHAVMGVHIKASVGASVSQGQDLVITPDRRVLVSSGVDNRIVEFNRFGQFTRVLVAPGSAGLSFPAGMLLTPGNRLAVSSRNNARVIEYDAATGAFVRDLVPAGSGGLSSPFGLALGPGGSLFVSETGGRVLRYNAATGAFQGVFVAAGSGELSNARGLVFNPATGNLLVASYGSNRVLEYSGATGAYIKNWAITGVNFAFPWCLRIGRNGNVYVSQNNLLDTHVTKPRISEFDARNGRWIRAYILGEDSLITQPTGFDFMPGDQTDCNRNQVPDSCDIASVFSRDHNGNGRPDECECYADCNGDGVLTIADFGCFQSEFVTSDPYADCDGSGSLTIADFGCFQTRFVQGCP